MNTRRFSLFALFVLCLCLATQAEGLLPGEIASGKQIYTDVNGDSMTVPDQFRVSEEPDEQTIRTGAVIISLDGSEFVWIPTTVTPLAIREFGSYFSGGSISSYYDETDSPVYQEMIASVEQHGGFYMDMIGIYYIVLLN